MKKFLRNLLRPLFLWLGYAADAVAFDNFPLKEDLTGFQRKVIGIYSSMNHSKPASKAEVWAPIISEERQIELLKQLAVAKSSKEALACPTRSGFQAAVYRQMSHHIKQDAEIVWLVDVFNFEAGIEDAMNSGPMQLLKGLGGIIGRG